mmetsp:Transcript_22864/g.56815  ORF Transcript_22864/g.56815 Transcript_22864/m.56815 type:complete len:160 (+) Transcript_22864:857-1336(+)
MLVAAADDAGAAASAKDALLAKTEAKVVELTRELAALSAKVGAANVAAAAAKPAAPAASAPPATANAASPVASAPAAPAAASVKKDAAPVVQSDSDSSDSDSGDEMDEREAPVRSASQTSLKHMAEALREEDDILAGKLPKAAAPKGKAKRSKKIKKNL